MDEGSKQDDYPAAKYNLPSLDQALPYIPLTSILPFPSDIIQIPEPYVPSEPPSLLSASEQSSLNHTLHVLNSGATNSQSSLNNISQTVNDLHHAVHSHSLPHYNIHVPPSTQNLHLQPQNAHSHSSSVTRLSPFAKMVLESISVPHSQSEAHLNQPNHTSYHHSSTSSSTHSLPFSNSLPHLHPPFVNIANHQATGFHAAQDRSSGNNFIHQDGHMSQASRRPTVVIRPHQTQEAAGTNLEYPINQHAQTVFSESALPVVNSTTFSQPQGPDIQHPAPRVIVPSFPTSSHPSQYLSHPNADALAIQQDLSSPRKRKRDDNLPHPTIPLDHRDVADSELRGFQELLVNVFEAENQLDPNVASSTSDQSPNYFIIDRDRDGTSVALLPSLLATVDSATTKIIKLNRFAQIPAQQITHLQQILLGSLRLASEIDLTLHSDFGDDALEQWSSYIETAENSLRASKLLLTMMTAGREENELYSEELTGEIVNNLRHILENGLIPLVEGQHSLEVKDALDVKSEQKAAWLSILQRSGRVLKLVGDLLLINDLSEAMVTTVEYLATKIVFTENSQSEKESLLGVQKFEVFRRHAMDVVAKVFLQYPDQRSFLLNEILSSLEKLPVTRQSARQFKLLEGKPIQLVSALIMQLIQTSTMKTISDHPRLGRNGSEHESEEDQDSQSDDSEQSNFSSSGVALRRPRKKALMNGNATKKEGALSLLEDTSAAFMNTAQSNASYISRYLVQRALSSTKTGDQPYRNLLDIFTEDFLNVLDAPEWPTAELLLRALLSTLLGITNEEKSTAPAKNMALDLMGTIGSKIADIRNSVSRSFKSLETSALNSIQDIASMFEDLLLRGDALAVSTHLHGPYLMVIDYLEQSGVDNLQYKSAKLFYLVQWARSLCANSSSRIPEEGDDEQKYNFRKEEASRWLSNVLQDPNRAILDRSSDSLNRMDIRSCHALVLLSLPLCQASDRIFHALVQALSSQQATVRSRSVKSVSLLLDKDPSILQRSSFIMQRILQSASDPSPLVRDSALALVGKCITINPGLRIEATKTLIANSADHSVAVRKRAMKLLRDVYLENTQQDMRAIVADSILRRLNDIEESIAELAAQTMEDIWLSPFEDMPAQAALLSIQQRNLVQEHTSLIAATVAQSEDISTSIEALFKRALSVFEKNCKSNRNICKLFVSVFFENIIDNDQEQETPSQKSSLQTLTVLARAEPSLFDADQMLTLRPYIDNISFTADDLPIYRSTISIYRRVLPVLPPLQKSFLLGVQEVLLNTVSKLGRQELEEVAACLWIIDGVLENTERLARLMASVLRNIEAISKTYPTADHDVKRLRKLLMLAGAFGKACNLQSQVDFFQKAFDNHRFDSVSSLIVDVMNPLAASEHLEIVREVALESIGLVCQAWPENYLKSHISATFHAALKNDNARLTLAILSGFRSFYMAEDNRNKDKQDESPEKDDSNATNRLGNSMTVTYNDGAATSIAQQFLPRIIDIALSSKGSLALIATDIVASTNRQGLVHPRECGPALVALETSPEEVVAKVAYEEHQNLHAKHESMLEKEYMKAIERAFTYQCKTWGSPSGVDAGLNPKLRAFYEVIRNGSLPLRKKLFTNLCAKLVIDDRKAISDSDFQDILLFSQFVLENISLFEYGRLEELLHLISTIEKIFSSCGDPLSQRVEVLIRAQPTLSYAEAEAFSEHRTDVNPVSQNFDPAELKLVTLECMLLSLLWQTRSFLCRAWNLNPQKLAKSKLGSKDVNKAPNRISNPPIEEHLDKISQIMAALSNVDAMFNQCQVFLGLINVDSDLKLGLDEEEDVISNRFDTPSEAGTPSARELGSITSQSGSRKREIRRSMSARMSTPSSTPKRSGRTPTSAKRRIGQILGGDEFNDNAGNDEGDDNNINMAHDHTNLSGWAQAS